MISWLSNFIRRLVRNFAPELHIDRRSFRYLLARRAVETSVEFVEQHMSGAVALETKEALHDYAVQRAPEDGLVLELGVRNGTSINLIARMSDRIVHGFDSFEGLPDDGIIPRSKLGNAKWYAGKMHMQGEFPQVPDNVELHKGWFDDVLPEFFKENKEPIAYMHIDCDIYSSTKTVLECARRNIRPGTIIVFDEYLNYEGWQKNEHRAWVEFADAAGLSSEFIAYSYPGSAALQIIGVKSTKTRSGAG